MNESRHEPIIGIDSAYDEMTVRIVDVDVLKLALIIITYITKHRDELTDSYYDLIMNATDNIVGVNHLTLKEYSDYILNMTFSYAGRMHYDDIRGMVIRFCQGQTIPPDK